MVEEKLEKDDVKIIQTDIDSENGLNKCPKCGATDITLNVNNGKLRCNYCRYEFEPVKVEGFVEELSSLTGQVIASGAQNIVADTKDVMTFKCSSCGAEVVVDTASSSQARCHWCRNTLSVNQQIPNGSIPDVVLPFTLRKEEARDKIEEFVHKRRFFAHPQFKKEFTTENIMGVYFPYMIVDVNSHARFSGEGEHETRSYYRKRGDTRQKVYDADVYEVEREYDLTIDGLTVESRIERLGNNNEDKTNNVINSILPFDIENCVKYDSNYLKGYTSEKRDVNIDELKLYVETQAKDVARFAANKTLEHYDRGVFWAQQDFTIRGEQWKSAYLPVWLYSYQQVRGKKKKLHYVAVNARTKEVMGSVPVNQLRLFIASLIVEFFGVLAMLFFDEFDYNFVFLAAGFIYYFVIYEKYRNKEARHTYEAETKTEMTNLIKFDKYLKKRTGLTNSKIQGANNTSLEAGRVSKHLIKKKKIEEINRQRKEKDGGNK